MTTTNLGEGALSRAVAAGDLVQADPDLTKELGLAYPWLFTRTAWDRYVHWTEEDTERTGQLQDQTGRLWDVLWMSHVALAAQARPRRGVTVDFYCVSRDPALAAQGARPAQVDVAGFNRIEPHGITTYVLVSDVDEATP